MPKSRRIKRKRHLPLEESTQVMCRALRDAGLSEYAQRLHIFQCWNEVVGPKIAARTAPDVFRAGVLFVKVTTPTWQQELSYLKGDIIAKLNQALGKIMVHELKVVCGTRPPAQGRAPEAKRMPRPAAHDYAAASAASCSITCPKVRAAFESLMAKDLWSKRQSAPSQKPPESDVAARMKGSV